MRSALIVSCLVLAAAAAATAQDLSPLTQDHIELGADYDGRKSFCKVLTEASEHAKDFQATGCEKREITIAARPEHPADPGRRFLARPAGAILYIDGKVVVRRGTQPISTADLQTKLERLGVTTVSGLLQAFGFQTVTVEGGPRRELHYNDCE